MENDDSMDVDSYLRRLPDRERVVLEGLRETIRKTAKGAEESIKYHIPSYRYKGWLVHFKTGKRFCSFITGSPTVITAFKKELERFDISGTTIHFNPENPLPKSLIRKTVKARMKENDARK